MPLWRGWMITEIKAAGDRRREKSQVCRAVLYVGSVMAAREREKSAGEGGEGGHRLERGRVNMQERRERQRVHEKLLSSTSPHN